MIFERFRRRNKVKDNASFVKEDIQNIIDMVLSSSSLPVIECIENEDDAKRVFSKYHDLIFRDNIINRLAKVRVGEEMTFYNYAGGGKCEICNKDVNFVLDSQWTTYTEGLGCPECHFNSRLRNIWHFIIEYYKPGKRVYISEQTTSFFNYLQKMIPDLVGSEYDPMGKHKGIRHEDVTALSFSESMFDLYISNDVFEHVFDYKRAFREASRVLKDAGVLLFHVPFSFKPKTSIRARLNADGSVENLEEPVFHMNPISAEGSLWVNDFGWDMLDDLREAGFSHTCAIWSHNVSQGFLHETALVFKAVK